MKAVLVPFVRVFGSLWLSVTLLMLVGLLTWLGTLEQVNTGLFEVQKKYFESFYLIQDVGPFSIPLPGAHLVLCLLFVNLVTGGLVMIRKDWSKAGIMIAHCGILFLLRGAGLEGPFNFVAPNPVRQLEFARALGKFLCRPAIVPAPAFALRLVLGEFGAVSLFSQNARPANLLEAGFTFGFPDLGSALQDILPQFSKATP